MNTKNILGTLAITTIVATSLAFAQDANLSADASVKLGGQMMGKMQGRPWMNASGTVQADMKNLRGDMQAMMASITANLTATQKAAIATKLGITVEALQAKIASGTPLQMIISGKITREDMMKIIPPPMMASGSASSSMGMMHEDGRMQYDQKPAKGFFKSIFSKLFGKGDEMPKESMEMNADANINANANANGGGIRNFLKHLFNF